MYYLVFCSYATDLVVCSALGVDMYDCVFPTRTAVSGVTVWGRLCVYVCVEWTICIKFIIACNCVLSVIFTAYMYV